MELPVARQLTELWQAAALGLGLGLLYDILRVFRHRLHGLTGCLDLLFSVFLLLALFGFTLYGGKGYFRIFHAVGILLGGALWFLTVSSAVIRLLDCLLSLALKPWRRILKAASVILKKFVKKCKKAVAFGEKNDMIYKDRE